jgi:PPOX class probable F420-dependent enzyme
VIFDPTTERGARALARLATERVAWLTTVTATGQPQTMPIWFLWADGELLVYSDRRARRNANVAASPRVSVHLDDRPGDYGVAIEGEARIDPDAPGVPDNPAYLEKYGSWIDASYGGPVVFSGTYSVPIRITPTRAVIFQG